MKKLLTIISLLTIAISTTAYAKSPINRGVVVDHYKTVIDRSPYQVEVCEQVTIKGGDPTSGAIIGGIIGGVIGNQMKGKNSGEAGAVIGAIIGIENEKKKGSGGTYNRCYIETRYNEVQREVYSHSILEFEYEGKWHSVSFVK